MNDNNQSGVPDSTTECQRLRELVAYLERLRDEDQQRIVALTAERDQYERTLLKWYDGQLSEEQLTQWATDESRGQTLDEVFQELGIAKPN